MSAPFDLNKVVVDGRQLESPSRSSPTTSKMSLAFLISTSPPPATPKLVASPGEVNYVEVSTLKSIRIDHYSDIGWSRQFTPWLTKA